MTNYRRGRSYEYAIINFLKKTGRFYEVVRTAGSHGTFDVIAKSNDMVLFIQAKSNYSEVKRPLKHLYDMGGGRIPRVKEEVWLKIRGKKAFEVFTIPMIAKAYNMNIPFPRHGIPADKIYGEKI